MLIQIFFATRAVLKLGNTFPRQLGNVRSRDAFRPISRERKYLMDYKCMYTYFAVILKFRSQIHEILLQ